MKIGLIDLDNLEKLKDLDKNINKITPNLCIMKISTYHKKIGDDVSWYNEEEFYDRVYVSKVFSFTPYYERIINAKEVIYGGSGFAIELVKGREIYMKNLDKNLPYEIEHIMPDYSLYGIKNTAYGFLTRGCPLDCDFCHVTQMQGKISTKVADLSEFWTGQNEIVLFDPNITACKDWKQLFQQLIDSKAYINFSQGINIRTMTREKAEMIKQMKIKQIHFAWDRIEDKNIVVKKLKEFKEITGLGRRKIIVYCIVGDRQRKVTDADIERITTLRELDCWPYIMIYDKEHLKRGHELKKLQRWVNNRIIYEKCETFEEYKSNFI